MITAALIVKNEAENLPGCLDSLRGRVDQINVTDTGSKDSDETERACWEFGVFAHEHPWADDFSAARNYALSKCNGDWILSIDADERLETDPRETVENAGDTVGFWVNKEATVNGVDSVRQELRLFRNLPWACWRGRIHEEIGPSLKGPFEKSEVVIQHLPISGENDEIKQKMERNVRIGLLDLQERPGNQYVMFHLGCAYHALGQYDYARMMLERAIGDLTPHLFKKQAVSILIDSLCRLGRGEDALSLADEGLGRWPDCPELVAVRSLAVKHATAASDVAEGLQRRREAGLVRWKEEHDTSKVRKVCEEVTGQGCPEG